IRDRNVTEFRRVLFRSVLEMDILTGTGEIVTCSREKNVDLFRAFPNSYGCLGYAVRLKIELEEVADFIELNHVRFHDVETYEDEIGRASCRERGEVGVG